MDDKDLRIQDLKAENEKLRKELEELKESALDPIEMCKVSIALDKLKEYQRLEEQGLLLKLSCNVGDTVYTNFSMQGWYMRKKDRPYKAKIVFVGINGEDNFMNVDLGKGAMLSFKFSEIGKTVFLTEQEAQAALEKLKAGGVNG